MKYLFFMRCCHENRLHIFTHVKLRKKPVTFIKNKMLDLGKIQDLYNPERDKRGEEGRGRKEKEVGKRKSGRVRWERRVQDGWIEREEIRQNESNKK